MDKLIVDKEYFDNIEIDILRLVDEGSIRYTWKTYSFDEQGFNSRCLVDIKTNKFADIKVPNTTSITHYKENSKKSLKECYEGILKGKVSQLAEEIKSQNNEDMKFPIFGVYEPANMFSQTSTPYFVQAFFTRKGAEQWVEDNKDNTYPTYGGEARRYPNGLEIIVEDGMFNPEWVLIKEFISGINWEV